MRTTFAHVAPPELYSGMQTVRGHSPGRGNSLTKEAAQAGARSSSQHNARKTSQPRDAARETFTNFQRLFNADTSSIDSDDTPVEKHTPSILENLLNLERNDSIKVEDQVSPSSRPLSPKPVPAAADAGPDQK